MFVSPKSKFLFEIFPCQMPRPEFRVWGLQKKASTKFNGFRLVWSTKWHNANVVIIIIIITTRCKPKPGCSPPGYPPRRLLIIVDWSINWFVCVQRSTCTSCCIQSHASIREMSEGEMPRGNARSQGVNVRSPVYRCCRQKSSTVDLVYYTYDGRARRGWMHKVYYTLVTVTKYCMDWIHKNRLPQQVPERSQPHFTAIIYVHKATIQVWKCREHRSRTFRKNCNRTNSKNRKQFRQLGSSKVI